MTYVHYLQQYINKVRPLITFNFKGHAYQLENAFYLFSCLHERIYYKVIGPYYLIVIRISDGTFFANIHYSRFISFVQR